MSYLPPRDGRHGFPMNRQKETSSHARRAPPADYDSPYTPSDRHGPHDYYADPPLPRGVSRERMKESKHRFGGGRYDQEKTDSEDYYRGDNRRSSTGYRRSNSPEPPYREPNFSSRSRDVPFNSKEQHHRDDDDYGGSRSRGRVRSNSRPPSGEIVDRDWNFESYRDHERRGLDTRGLPERRRDYSERLPPVPWEKEESSRYRSDREAYNSVGSSPQYYGRTDTSSPQKNYSEHGYQDTTRRRPQNGRDFRAHQREPSGTFRDEDRSYVREECPDTKTYDQSNQESAAYGTGLDPFQKLIDQVAQMKLNERGELTEFCREFYVPHPVVQHLSLEDAEAERRRRHITIVHPRDPTVVPNPVLTFEQASFPPAITDVLQIKYKQPTPIQVQGWPIALSGHDLIGIAETGSGKTLAFALPALVHIKAQPPTGPGAPIALVLAPTRELAVQIGDETRVFAKTMGLDVVTLYGQMENSSSAFQQLANKAELVVACPGKLMDLAQRGRIRFHRVTYFVLDEADRLLQMGFREQIDAINKHIRPDRQVLMWSATWGAEVRQCAWKVFPDVGQAYHIQIGCADKAVDTIRQQFILCEDEYDKMDKFYAFMEQTAHRMTLVFCNTKSDVDLLVHQLPEKTHRSVFPERLHGGMEQHQRLAALRKFKDKQRNCLVATEVASRGLDIDNILQVVNYGCPKDIEAYIHRIGRTGRAGRSGEAITFVQWGDQQIASAFFGDLPRCLQNSRQPIPPFIEEFAANAGGGRSFQTSYRSDRRGGRDWDQSLHRSHKQMDRSSQWGSEKAGQHQDWNDDWGSPKQQQQSDWKNHADKETGGSDRENRDRIREPSRQQAYDNGHRTSTSYDAPRYHSSTLQTNTRTMAPVEGSGSSDGADHESTRQTVYAWQDDLYQTRADNDGGWGGVSFDDQAAEHNSSEARQPAAVNDGGWGDTSLDHDGAAGHHHSGTDSEVVRSGNDEGANNSFDNEDRRRFSSLHDKESINDGGWGKESSFSGKDEYVVSSQPFPGTECRGPRDSSHDGEWEEDPEANDAHDEWNSNNATFPLDRDDSCGSHSTSRRAESYQNGGGWEEGSVVDEACSETAGVSRQSSTSEKKQIDVFADQQHTAERLTVSDALKEDKERWGETSYEKQDRSDSTCGMHVSEDGTISKDVHAEPRIPVVSPPGLAFC